MALELVLTLAEMPPITSTCGAREESKKLTDIANGKDKNTWVFNYALPVDLKGNGLYTKMTC